MFENRYLTEVDEIVSIRFQNRTGAAFAVGDLVEDSVSPAINGEVIYIDTLDIAGQLTGYLFLRDSTGGWVTGNAVKQNGGTGLADIIEVKTQDKFDIPETDRVNTGFEKNYNYHTMAGHFYNMIQSKGYRIVSEGQIRHASGKLQFNDNVYISLPDLDYRLKIPFRRHEVATDLNIVAGTCTVTAGTSLEDANIQDGDYVVSTTGLLSAITNVNYGAGTFDLNSPPGDFPTGNQTGFYFRPSQYNVDTGYLELTVGTGDFNMLMIDIPEIEPNAGNVPTKDMHITDFVREDSSPGSTNRNKRTFVIGTYFNDWVSLFNGDIIKDGQALDFSQTPLEDRLADLESTVKSDGKIEQDVADTVGINDLTKIPTSISSGVVVVDNEQLDAAHIKRILEANIYAGKTFHIDGGTNEGKYAINAFLISSENVGGSTLVTDAAYAISKDTIYIPSGDLGDVYIGHLVELQVGGNTVTVVIKSKTANTITIETDVEAPYTADLSDTTWGSFLNDAGTIATHQYTKLTMDIETDENNVPPDFKTSITNGVLTHAVIIPFDVQVINIGGSAVVRIDAEGNVTTTGSQYTEIDSIVKSGGVVGDDFDTDEFRVNARSIFGGHTNFGDIGEVVAGKLAIAQFRRPIDGPSGLDLVANNVASGDISHSILARHYNGASISTLGSLEFIKHTTTDHWLFKVGGANILNITAGKIGAYKNILPNGTIDIGAPGGGGVQRFDNGYFNNVDSTNSTISTLNISVLKPVGTANIGTGLAGGYFENIYGRNFLPGNGAANPSVGALSNYFAFGYFDSLLPGTGAATETIGTSGNQWQAAYIKDVRANQIVPSGGLNTLGLSGTYWATAYVTTANLTTINSNSIQPTAAGPDKKIGASGSYWTEAFITTIKSTNIYPSSTGNGELGNVSNIWGAARINTLKSTDNFPATTGAGELGNGSNIWGAARINTVKSTDNFPAATGTGKLGDASNKWGSADINTIVNDTSITSGNVFRKAGGTVNVGGAAAASRFDNGYFTNLYGYTAVKTDYLEPITPASAKVGDAGSYWNAAYITTGNIKTVNSESIQPSVGVKKIGDTGAYWSNSYIDNMYADKILPKSGGSNKIIGDEAPANANWFNSMASLKQHLRHEFDWIDNVEQYDYTTARQVVPNYIFNPTSSKNAWPGDAGPNGELSFLVSGRIVAGNYVVRVYTHNTDASGWTGTDIASNASNIYFAMDLKYGPDSSIHILFYDDNTNKFRYFKKIPSGSFSEISSGSQYTYTASASNVFAQMFIDEENVPHFVFVDTPTTISYGKYDNGYASLVNVKSITGGRAFKIAYSRLDKYIRIFDAGDGEVTVFPKGITTASYITTSSSFMTSDTYISFQTIDIMVDSKNQTHCTSLVGNGTNFDLKYRYFENLDLLGKSEQIIVSSTAPNVEGGCPRMVEMADETTKIGQYILYHTKESGGTVKMQRRTNDTSLTDWFGSSSAADLSSLDVEGWLAVNWMVHQNGRVTPVWEDFSSFNSAQYTGLVGSELIDVDFSLIPKETGKHHLGFEGRRWKEIWGRYGQFESLRAEKIFANALHTENLSVKNVVENLGITNLTTTNIIADDIDTDSIDTEYFRLLKGSYGIESLNPTGGSPIDGPQLKFTNMRLQGGGTGMGYTGTPLFRRPLSVTGSAYTSERMMWIMRSGGALDVSMAQFDPGDIANSRIVHLGFWGHPHGSGLSIGDEIAIHGSASPTIISNYFIGSGGVAWTRGSHHIMNYEGDFTFQRPQRTTSGTAFNTIFEAGKAYSVPGKGGQVLLRSFNVSGASPDNQRDAVWEPRPDENTIFFFHPSASGIGDLGSSLYKWRNTWLLNSPTVGFTGGHFYRTTQVKENYETSNAVKLLANGKIEHSDTEKDPTVIGLIQKKINYDRISNEHDLDEEKPDVAYVSAVGDSYEDELRGIKAVDDGGEVAQGDLLCSSNTEGRLQKQTPFKLATKEALNSILDAITIDENSSALDLLEALKTEAGKDAHYPEEQLFTNYTVAKSYQDVDFDINGEADEIYGSLHAG